ncbi:MAG: hypothetical protein KJ721_01950, partial [Nanoarchaeota archaeon]|nr:hypothetical protein [Nanoarchaeota archaeon]
KQALTIASYYRAKNYIQMELGKANVRCGDSRLLSKIKCETTSKGIDLVITSPPYATALPYLDTDRLSLSFLQYLNSKSIKDKDRDMVGNREINNKERKKLETNLLDNSDNLPNQTISLIHKIYNSNKDWEVGFRRKNKAALLYNYFSDMKKIINELYLVMNKNASLFLIVGNNFTIAGGRKIEITTDCLLEEIGTEIDFKLIKSFPITVTGDNLVHSKNLIKQNKIIHLKR